MASGASHRPQPVGIAAWPLVDGRITWAVAYGSTLHSGHLEPAPAGKNAVDLLIKTLQPLMPPKVNFVQVRGLAHNPIVARLGQYLDHRAKPRANELARIAEAALVGERLVVPRSSRLHVPEGLDPYLVATDASVVNGQAAWAYVTGAGWYATGHLNTTSTQFAEWVAVCEAVRLFPKHASLQLITDNEGVSTLVQTLVTEGEAARRPSWLTKQTFAVGSRFILTRSVEARWIPRNSHPLHALADRLCGNVSRGYRRPTARSQQSRQQTSRHLEE